MSESEHRKQQSELCNGGNGDEENDEDGDDDDDDDEDNEEKDCGRGGEGASGESKVEEERRREVSGRGVFGISRDFRNAVKRSFHRKKKKKKKRRKEKEKEREGGDGVISRLPSSSSSAGRGGGGGGGGDVGCYLCFLQPRTAEGPETPTSDPNSDSFSYEMLRTLIEKNDFYRKECNPHN